MIIPSHICSECSNGIISKTSSHLEKKDLFVKKGIIRKLCYAPVGNYFNFGKYKDGRTPVIAIIGISTSPSARDDYLIDYNGNCRKFLKASVLIMLLLSVLIIPAVFLFTGCDVNLLRKDTEQRDAAEKASDEDM